MAVRTAVASYARQSSGLSQNAVIAAALLIGFVVYLTIKGRLSAYVNLLFSSRGKAASSVGPSQSSIGAGTATGATGAGSGRATQPLQGLTQPQQIAPPSGNVPIYDNQGNPNGYGDPNYAILSGGNVDTSTFGGTGAVSDPYTGPLFTDTTTGF